MDKDFEFQVWLVKRIDLIHPKDSDNEQDSYVEVIKLTDLAMAKSKIKEGEGSV
jgi:hypothetical protein